MHNPMPPAVKCPIIVQFNNEAYAIRMGVPGSYRYAGLDNIKKSEEVYWWHQLSHVDTYAITKDFVLIEKLYKRLMIAYETDRMNAAIKANRNKDFGKPIRARNIESEEPDPPSSRIIEEDAGRGISDLVTKLTNKKWFTD